MDIIGTVNEGNFGEISSLNKEHSVSAAASECRLFGERTVLHKVQNSDPIIVAIIRTLTGN